MTPRRFPPPWRTDKIPGGYVVRDTNGQALAYIYSRDSEAEAMQAKVLTKDEARRIAVKHRQAAGATGQFEKFILKKADCAAAAIDASSAPGMIF
jgi:K+/H+ antiporter YhaU regulatory subunit KhtT